MKIKDIRDRAYTIMPVDKPDIESSPGCEIDLDHDHDLAFSLLEQVGNFVPLDDEAKAAAEQIAEARDGKPAAPEKRKSRRQPTTEED